MARGANRFGASRRKSRRSGDPVFQAGWEDEPPIGEEIDNPGIRWDLMMVLFLRLTAAVWLVKGIGYWGVILGFGDAPFIEESRLRQGLIVTLALVDSAAAVGLWLVSPWGKSLWVFVAVTELALALTGIGRLLGQSAAWGIGLALFFFFVLAFAVRRRHLGYF